MSESTLYVFVHLDGQEPVLAGRLIMDETLRSEQARFEYAASYLNRREAVAIDPIRLPLPPPGQVVEYRTTPGIPLFGGIRDAAPDQWGRDLMVAAAGRPLRESEFLLASSEHRAGDLAFGSTPDHPRRTVYWEGLAHVDAILDVTQGIEAIVRLMSSGAPEGEFIRQFIDRGSSLGGSRPKASVYDGGRLWIAKFNTRSDPYNMARIEHANMQLARLCGIDVPEVRLMRVGDHDVFLSERFDRAPPAPHGDGAMSARAFAKVGTISGMTVFDHLNLSDARHAGTSYRDVCDQLRHLGARHAEDRKQLFRRMVFNILCGNNDDHLRNLALIRDAQGRYRLSPAYDLVPYPQTTPTRTLILTVGSKGTLATTNNALSWPEAFGFEDRRDASQVIQQMLSICGSWPHVYASHLVSKNDIRRLAEGHCFDPQHWRDNA